MNADEYKKKAQANIIKERYKEKYRADKIKEYYKQKSKEKLKQECKEKFKAASIKENYKNKSKVDSIKQNYKEKSKADSIKENYKEKFKEDGIKENYKEKSKADSIKENYKEKFKEDSIKENYKDKAKEEKIIYEYKLLREVRPIYKILNNLSRRINTKLKEMGIKRELTYTQILGSTVREFEEYLASKMTDGMSYDNYGMWEVDHIIPFSSFDFNDLEELRKCGNYRNLQPLWMTDNRKKSNKQ